MSMGTFVLRTVVVATAKFALGFIAHPLPLGLRSAFPGSWPRSYSKGPSGCFWLGQGVRSRNAIWGVAPVPFYRTNSTIEPRPGVFVAKILAWEMAAVAALGGLTPALANADPGILEGGTF